MCIAQFGEDQLVVDFCERRDSAEGNFFPPFDIGEILFSNAYAYPGLTLVAHDDPAGQLLHMAERLMANMPTAAKLDADLQAQEAKAKEEEKRMTEEEKERNENVR